MIIPSKTVFWGKNQYDNKSTKWLFSQKSYFEAKNLSNHRQSPFRFRILGPATRDRSWLKKVTSWSITFNFINFSYSKLQNEYSTQAYDKTNSIKFKNTVLISFFSFWFRQVNLWSCSAKKSLLLNGTKSTDIVAKGDLGFWLLYTNEYLRSGIPYVRSLVNLQIGLWLTFMYIVLKSSCLLKNRNKEWNFMNTCTLIFLICIHNHR